MIEEERCEMMRSNYAAQMEMLGYDASGNSLDMVHVVRCRDCKRSSYEWRFLGLYGRAERGHMTYGEIYEKAVKVIGRENVSDYRPAVYEGTNAIMIWLKTET